MFQCQECSQQFSRNDNLKRHVSNIHRTYPGGGGGIEVEEWKEEDDLGFNIHLP